MRLNVIIPTYNRQELLQRTLHSLLAARVPSGLDVQVTVVDNNSKDDTAQTVERWVEKFGGRLNYQFESRQGRSFALNTGIRSTAGDLIGMVDDDEEVNLHWYEVTYDAFKTGNVDFIGGPYEPRWGDERPGWLPVNYLGVIGWIDGGGDVRPYDESYPGILMGGNAVISRPMLDRVGLYSTSLGRTGTRLLAGEDEDMYERLRAAGARGVYRPDLIIYHYVPPERLTKRYFRQWCFWRGVSKGVMCKDRPADVPHLGGIPRYLYGEAVRGAITRVKGSFRKQVSPGRGFAGELAIWDLAGFFYGKHFFNPAPYVARQERA